MTIKEQIIALREACLRIDNQWRQHRRAVEEFPEIVLSCTDDLSFEWLKDPSYISESLSCSSIADLQRPSSFSDLYLRLFDNGYFWVEVLNWYGSDINIHDHDFSGVQFQSAGESLNVVYRFDPVTEYQGVTLGELSVQEVSLWEESGRSLVRPGRAEPHNVCHISVPTVSLLIRTHPQPSLGPQWNYFPPGVAGSYGVADPVFRKRIKLLRLLGRTNGEAFLSEFSKHANTSRADTLLFSMMKMTDTLFESGNHRALEQLYESHQGIGEEMVRALVAHRAMETCKHLRNRTNLSIQQRRALSVLGCAFDAPSAAKVANALPGLAENLMDVLHSIREHASEADWRRLRQLLPLYGMRAAA